jgi:hypothetical protein
LRFIYELLPLLTGAVAHAALLAEASAIEPGMASIFGSVVTAGVLAWYVIYDVRVRTPAMLNAFSTEQAAIRKAFTDEQEEIRRTFRDEQSAMRESYRLVIEGIRATFASEQGLIRNTFASEQTALRSHFEKEATELRNMLIENLKAMRTAVHDVRDTAQVLINKKALANAQEEAKAAT